MSYPFEVLALLLVVLSLMGMLWAMFWPKPSTRLPQAPAHQHWDLVYVDDDGVLLFTMVRVLELNLDSLRLTAWCSRTGAQRVFKLSKILKATDVQTGERVRLPISAHLNPESLVDERGASKTRTGHTSHRALIGETAPDLRPRPHIGWASSM